MPIAKRWSKMEREKIKRATPAKGGVYELTSFGHSEPLYIGCSSNLQRRLLEHLNDSKPNHFRFQKAGFFQSPESMEKSHFETYEAKYGKTPPWNTQDPRAGWL